MIRDGSESVGRPGLVSWLMLAVWGSWIAGLQAVVVATFDGSAAWIPDALTVLLLALCAELPQREAFKAAVILAAVRLAFSIEPPEATLCGLLVLTGVALALRAVTETSGILVRTIFAGFATAGFASWLILVHGARLGISSDVGLDAIAVWPTAVASATFALLFAPLLARLPGLSPLHRERW